MKSTVFPISTTNNESEQATSPALENISISVLVPSYNEEKGIGNVIQGFRQAVPSAEIFVYDNNSSDRTAEEAEKMEASLSRACGIILDTVTRGHQEAKRIADLSIPGIFEKTRETRRIK